jgi:hypothetical protein
MGLGGSRVLSDQFYLFQKVMRLQGAGAAAMTVSEGEGITITQNSTGNFRITLSDNQGTFVGALATFQAATPANVAGHGIVFDTYDTTTTDAPFIDFVITNAADAVHDLVSTEFVTIMLLFKRSSV